MLPYYLSIGKSFDLAVSVSSTVNGNNIPNLSGLLRGLNDNRI